MYKRNLDVDSKAWELKRNYLKRNQAYKRNMEECKSVHFKA